MKNITLVGVFVSIISMIFSEILQKNFLILEIYHFRYLYLKLKLYKSVTYFKKLLVKVDTCVFHHYSWNYYNEQKTHFGVFIIKEDGKLWNMVDFLLPYYIWGHVLLSSNDSVKKQLENYNLALLNQYANDAKVNKTQ